MSPRWEKPARRASSFVLAVVASVAVIAAQQKNAPSAARIQDITGEYRLGNPRNYLSIVQDGKQLHGSLSLTQSGEETAGQIDFALEEGSREEVEVKFRTVVIHGRSYAFTGRLERGNGKSRRDDDYLRIAGALVEHREGHPERPRDVVFRWVASELGR